MRSKVKDTQLSALDDYEYIFAKLVIYKVDMRPFAHYDKKSSFSTIFMS